MTEGWQEEENLTEIKAREYADGDSRGADPAVINDDDNQIAPHREVYKEEDPSGKKGDSTKKR